jgi:chemosensory pili system protein ChpC
MADTASRDVRCLLIPLEGVRLLVPDSAVAQVGSFVQPDPVSNAPAWLLGRIPWQKQLIPLLSFEAANGLFHTPPAGRARAAVMKVLDASLKLPCYGLLSTGIPHPLSVTAPALTADEGTPSGGPAVKQAVLLHGEPALIPDLDAIEDLLRGVRHLLG